MKDWASLVEQMRLILGGEGDLAGYISQRFSALALRARDAQAEGQAASGIRTEAEATRDALKRERERLLRQEVNLLDLV